MKRRFKRVYHPYHLWEEYHAGMWIVTAGEKRKSHAIAAANLMRNPEEFREAMLRAVNEWPISCEVNLTASSINQRAWLGHAGCCIATGSPEDCTRLGWHMLNEDEQNKANAAVDEAIEEWAKRYAEKKAGQGRSDRRKGADSLDV